MIVILIAAKIDVGRTPLTEAPPAAVLGWIILQAPGNFRMNYFLRLGSRCLSTCTCDTKSNTTPLILSSDTLQRLLKYTPGLVVSFESMVVVALGSVVVIVSVIVSVIVLVIVCVMVMVTEVVIVAVMDIVVVVVTVSVPLAKVANKAAAA